MISILNAIKQDTAALAADERGHGDGRTASRQARDRPRGASARPLAGQLLAEVSDPFGFEVHHPVRADKPPPGLPVLPTYVPREHDRQLAEVVLAAAAGTSGIAVLVGGSSTGKTRACWEALGLLRDRPERWRLWHPIDPSRPEAALRELPSIGPRTVVWLNEAQFCLDVAVGGQGERVAAGLRELVRDPARAPVVVLATLWPQFWDRLTGRPAAGEDSHAQARELLAGRDISVPAEFTAAQLRQAAAARDPRLARAAEVAQDRQVIQFLAGVPELMARYRNAPPPAAALINTGIDARRLGMGVALSLAFLEAAAPANLTDPEWDGLGEDWLEQALAYTTAPCNGIRGPLTPIRPRAIGAAVPAPRSACRLADYLDQHGRRARCHIPPPDFWTAAVHFASASDLPALAYAAEARGLLRDAARLRKHATAQGDTSAAATFVESWHSLHPDSADPKPAQWAAAHAAVDDPRHVARLLDAMWQAGTDEQAAALANRAVDHDCLDDPIAVARLLDAMREAGADEQATALANRAAAHAAIDDPGAVAGLLVAMWQAYADEQTAALLARDPAAHAAVDDPKGVARLLNAMREAGTDEQTAALANRAVNDVRLDSPIAVTGLVDAMREAGAAEPAAALANRAVDDVRLDDPFAVNGLLNAMREAGADEQTAALLARDPAAYAPLDNPIAVPQLLAALRQAGANEQAAALAYRAAAPAAVDAPGNVAALLDAMREAGADEQAAALASRAVNDVRLDDPGTVAWLLDAMREAGAAEQTAALASRAAAHVTLDSIGADAGLVDAMRKAGATEQMRTLVDRLAAEGRFDLFCKYADDPKQYRLGREPDGSPTRSWGWVDLD